MAYFGRAPAEDPALTSTRVCCKAAFAGLPPRLERAGLQLLERISTVNWLLEWNLPRWLGEVYGLGAPVTAGLTLGNVFGLAFVRLQDDLFDDAPGDERGGARRLAGELYNWWIAQYRPLFDRQSIFWEYLDRFTGQWLRATLEAGGPAASELRSARPGALRWLAARGAPLKICCAAACLLGGREAALPQLLEGVDRLLGGAVLVDHAYDWQEDLSAGRYNALAAFYAQPDVEQSSESIRQALMEELYLGEAGRDYFVLAQGQFRLARESVRGLGIGELEAYLDWAGEETAALARRLAAEAQQRLQTAAAAMMQTTQEGAVIHTPEKERR